MRAFLSRLVVTAALTAATLALYPALAIDSAHDYRPKPQLHLE